MERNDVWDIVNRAMEQMLVVKPCPVCKINVLMVKFTYEYKDGEDLWTMGEKLRCQGCLTLFTEGLTAVDITPPVV